MRSIYMIMIAAAAAVAVILILVFAIRRHRRNMEAKSHRVVMSDGIDVETQRRGSESGALFHNLYEAQTDVLLESGSGNYTLTLFDMTGGRYYRVSFRHSVGIGRAKDVQTMEQFISIPEDTHISGMHCKIFVAEKGILIEDMGSTNGTYLNEVRLREAQPLKDGDLIRIGDTKLKVML